MSIHRKSREEIKLMKYAGNVVALVHQEMKKCVCVGISTLELDKIAESIIRKNKCTPTFLGYYGYPGSICASINEQVVHGIPSENVILEEGDIISIDVGATFRNFVGDSAWTYPVGKISEENKRLLETTEKSLFLAIEEVKDGITLNDATGKIEDIAKETGLGIVREYGGHGIGSNMHEEPFIYNFRNEVNAKCILKAGMTICIEPMLNLGCDGVHTLSDAWTVVTNDNKPSAHFEHTLHVLENGVEILTKLQ